MARFKWIEWNTSKVYRHGLTPEDVEHAYANHIGSHEARSDGLVETFGRTAAGKLILIVWKYDDEYDALSDEYVAQVVFVITAF